MQQIDKDISNLNKIQKQKIHLDKRSALLYDGQGIFPSKNNYQKFLDMGVEEANEIETEALKKKIKEVKFDL